MKEGSRRENRITICITKTALRKLRRAQSESSMVRGRIYASSASRIVSKLLEDEL